MTPKTIWNSLLALFLFSSITQAQETEFTISTTGIAASGTSLPFWLISNQDGKYNQANSNYFLTEAGFRKNWSTQHTEKLNFSYGANLIYGYAGKSDVHLNEAYAGIRYSWLDLSAGAKADPLQFQGLSSTNGDILSSRNSRPIPKLSLSTNRNLYLGKRFSVSAKLEEGILNDDRFIENTRLHHKNFFIHYDFKRSWYFSLGLDHYVMWGGTHPKNGKSPSSFSDYIRYITGLAGGEEATASDQENAAGNHLGSYLLTIKKDWNDCSMTLSWNHIFEDASGRELVNVPDALYRIYFDISKKDQFISYFLYEFYHTKDQSDKPTLHGQRDDDNYFNNGYYQSGYTFHQRTIGSPFFTPKINQEGISTGIINNRFKAHHFGVGGVRKNFHWKSLFSWTQNYGTPSIKFEDNQFSFLTECTFPENKIPFDLTFKIAGDFGKLYEENIGGQILLTKHF